MLGRAPNDPTRFSVLGGDRGDRGGQYGEPVAFGGMGADLADQGVQGVQTGSDGLGHGAVDQLGAAHLIFPAQRGAAKPVVRSAFMGGPSGAGGVPGRLPEDRRLVRRYAAGRHRRIRRPRADDRTPGRAALHAAAAKTARAALAAGEPADPPPYDEFTPDELMPVLRLSKGGALRQVELALALLPCGWRYPADVTGYTRTARPGSPDPSGCPSFTVSTYQSQIVRKFIVSTLRSETTSEIVIPSRDPSAKVGNPGLRPGPFPS